MGIPRLKIRFLDASFFQRSSPIAFFGYSLGFLEKNLRPIVKILSSCYSHKPLHFFAPCKWLLLALLLGACTPPTYLSVRSEPVEKRDLASSYIKTPDPRQNCYRGEQIVVFWRIPRYCWIDSTEDWKLQVSIRYGKGTYQTVDVPLCFLRGHWTFPILNDDYDCLLGLQAFRVDLFQGENLMETWKHHVWVEPILLNPAINCFDK